MGFFSLNSQFLNSLPLFHTIQYLKIVKSYFLLLWIISNHASLLFFLPLPPYFFSMPMIIRFPVFSTQNLNPVIRLCIQFIDHCFSGNISWLSPLSQLCSVFSGILHASFLSSSYFLVHLVHLLCLHYHHAYKYGLYSNAIPKFKSHFHMLLIFC